MCPINPRLLRPLALSRFNPLAFPGLHTWWDAADANSVTLDGGRVAALADKSGNGRNAANSTSGSTQPDYIIGARNGRNAMRFVAASTQFLSVSGFATFAFLHQSTPSYVAMVVSVGNTDNPSSSFSMMGNGAAVSSLVGVTFSYRDTGVNNDALLVSVKQGGGAGTEVSQVIEQDFLPAQSTRVIDVSLDNANATAGERLKVRSNGVLGSVANTFTVAPAAGNAARNWQIGRHGNNSESFTGDICEVLMYSQQPTAQQQATIRQYLARKWGVTLA